ncbi:hypothetical protein KEM52_004530 [Ascosphaera acerosa]|nr:hypothetical protein KEM52_004530 [Ascosphaera acerosa]
MDADPDLQPRSPPDFLECAEMVYRCFDLLDKFYHAYTGQALSTPLEVSQRLRTIAHLLNTADRFASIDSDYIPRLGEVAREIDEVVKFSLPRTLGVIEGAIEIMRVRYGGMPDAVPFDHDDSGGGGGGGGGGGKWPTDPRVYAAAEDSMLHTYHKEGAVELVDRLAMYQELLKALARAHHQTVGWQDDVRLWHARLQPLIQAQIRIVRRVAYRAVRQDEPVALISESPAHDAPRGASPVTHGRARDRLRASTHSPTSALAVRDTEADDDSQHLAVRTGDDDDGSTDRSLDDSGSESTGDDHERRRRRRARRSVSRQRSLTLLSERVGTRLLEDKVEKLQAEIKRLRTRLNKKGAEVSLKDAEINELDVALQNKSDEMARRVAEGQAAHEETKAQLHEAREEVERAVRRAEASEGENRAMRKRVEALEKEVARGRADNDRLVALLSDGAGRKTGQDRRLLGWALSPPRTTRNASYDDERPLEGAQDVAGDRTQGQDGEGELGSPTSATSSGSVPAGGPVKSIMKQTSAAERDKSGMGEGDGEWKRRSVRWCPTQSIMR